MTNNNPTAPRLSQVERLALYSASKATTTMPDRPTDTSRNNQRAPRSVRHRAIR